MGFAATRGGVPVPVAGDKAGGTPCAHAAAVGVLARSCAQGERVAANMQAAKLPSTGHVQAVS